MRFEAALQNMSRGLAMFDREQRLVICARKHFAIDQLDPRCHSITPGGMGDAPSRNCTTCGY
jgi:hypothetical protein